MANVTFVNRMFEVIDENKDGMIEFAEYLQVLSILSTKATAEEKLRFSYKIYDFDGDNIIRLAPGPLPSLLSNPTCIGGMLTGAPARSPGRAPAPAARPEHTLFLLG